MSKWPKKVTTPASQQQIRDQEVCMIPNVQRLSEADVATKSICYGFGMILATSIYGIIFTIDGRLSVSC